MTNSRATKRLESAGMCIYCLSKCSDLTREHIIPFALNGNVVLPQASCGDCQLIINREIENPLLNKHFKDLRVFYNYKSKKDKNKKIPTVEVVEKLRNGGERRFRLGMNLIKPPLISNKFGEPSFVCRDKSGDFQPATLEAVFSDEDKLYLHKLANARPDIESVSITTPRYFPGMLPRLLAKISLGMMFSFSRDTAINSNLRNIVLGHESGYVKDDNGGHIYPWLYSVRRDKGILVHKENLVAFERTEDNSRWLYVFLNLAPEFFPDIYFVKVASRESGPMRQFYGSW